MFLVVGCEVMQKVETIYSRSWVLTGWVTSMIRMRHMTHNKAPKSHKTWSETPLGNTKVILDSFLLQGMRLN
jgi:hypothetical protein